MAFPILMIAGIFFLVTMALTVGPLLLCRLFVGPSKAGVPRSDNRPFMTGVVTACGLIVGVAVAVFGLYFARGQSREAATRVEDRPATFAGPREIPAGTVSSERSLFDGTPAYTGPISTGHSDSHGISLGAILVPLLLLSTLAALMFDRLRGGLLRLLPLVIACGVLVVLFVRSSAQREYHQTETARRQAQIATLHMEKMAQAETRRRIAVELRPTDVNAQKGSSVEAPTVSTERESASLLANTAVESMSSTNDPNSVSHDNGKDLPVFEYAGTNAIGVERNTLPVWVSDSEADGAMQVIRSGPHATVELAQQQALASLKSQLRADLVRRHPEASNWQPPDELVLHSGSILRRAVERSEITVGEFTTPMYEVYWQVDPTIGAGSLENAWRPSVVKQRLFWLGGGVGLLTLLLGSLAAGLRVDEQTEGKRRKALTLGTLAVWAVVGGAVLLAA